MVQVGVHGQHERLFSDVVYNYNQCFGLRETESEGSWAGDIHTKLKYLLVINLNVLTMKMHFNFHLDYSCLRA